MKGVREKMGTYVTRKEMCFFCIRILKNRAKVSMTLMNYRKSFVKDNYFKFVAVDREQ